MTYAEGVATTASPIPRGKKDRGHFPSAPTGIQAGGKRIGAQCPTDSLESPLPGKLTLL